VSRESGRATNLTTVRGAVLEHPVLATLVLALVIRLVAAIFVAVLADQAEFTDVGIYDRLAEERANGEYRDWGARSEFFYDRFATYVLPLSLLYRALGAFVFWGQLLAAIAGAVAAALTCKLLLMVTCRRWALFGGAIVALLPSLVVWSSTVLRDSFVWMITAGMALACAHAARERGWRLLGLGAGLAGLVFLLGHLRWSTMIVASWALVIAALFSAGRERLGRTVGALAIMVLLPWYLGAGPAGLDYAARLSPAEVRAERAVDADSALVDEETDGEGFASDLAHRPRGLSVMLLEPFPVTSFEGTYVRLAQLEIVVWYPLLVVAGFGVREAFRRRRLLAFSMVTGGTLLVVYALSEGNFGTAFRHRGELVPPIAVLAALGAPRLLHWWQERHDRAGARPGADLTAT
jgi:hypothetical protein